ncbi:chorismate--pyruvate lyase family protein [Paraglaciecola marina]|uniref:chorismate--pyruvate lyase family protein n=1 Tax=Paraglaciecola marina TaxID=2500157 RepID=UPI001060FBBD|nr:chorismate pyruvate-lyase family protein [Paraglaciecola marina]
MLKEHFRSRGFIEGGIVRNINEDAMDMEALPPFLRTLLVTDGTVTKSLEAFFWESIKVEKRWQEEFILTMDLPFIQAKVDDLTLKREVILRGVSTNDIYAYATSYLRTELLDENIKAQMIEGKIGIGELLREIGLETYREIVDFGREVFQAYNRLDGEPEYVETIYRTYIIHIGGKPAMQITERFPIRLFQNKAK